MLSLANFLPPVQPKTPAVKSARSKNRAAAYQHDLAKWREWRLLNASTDHQRTVIELEYQQQLEAGPDFCGYRKGSSFAEPPAHDLTREDRNRILVLFDGVRAGLYKHCRRDRGQAVSRAYRDVLGVLLSYAVKRSRVFPSLETIARLALVSVSTVQNAIAWLTLFGFLDRIRRVKRVAGVLGPRVRQTSNAYELRRMPSRLGAMAVRVFGLSSSQTTLPSSLSIDACELLPSGRGPAVPKGIPDAPPNLMAVLEALGASVKAAGNVAGGKIGGTRG